MNEIQRTPPHAGNGCVAKLRNARIGRGMTREHVARLARVRESEVWAAERGEDVASLAAICFVVGVDVTKGRVRG